MSVTGLDTFDTTAQGANYWLKIMMGELVKLRGSLPHEALDLLPDSLVR